MFVLAHFAGPVRYDAAGFIDKNRDTLQPGLAAVCADSTNPLLAASFVQPLARFHHQLVEYVIELVDLRLLERHPS